jgi:predicted transcriptional regulator
MNTPLAKDIMATKLVTLPPDSRRFAEAIRVLVKNSISGAPVIDNDGKLPGVSSPRNAA